MNNHKLKQVLRMKQIKRTIAILFFAGCLHGTAFSQTFTLKSKDLGGQITNAQMLNSFGCIGENKSPQLEWSNAPAAAKSFAVTMYDMDAPTGSGYWHWVVYNIPATTTDLKQDAGNVKKQLLPEGAIQGNSDFGVPGYGGPCPPVGDRPHAYLFTVYALSVDKLPIDKNSTAPNTGFVLNGNLLSKASLIVYSKR